MARVGLLLLLAAAAVAAAPARADREYATSNAARAYFTNGKPGDAFDLSGDDRVDGGGLGGVFRVRVDAGDAAEHPHASGAADTEVHPYMKLDVGKSGKLPRWSDAHEAWGVCVVRTSARSRETFEVLLTDLVAGEADGAPSFVSAPVPGRLLNNALAPVGSTLHIAGCRLFYDAEAPDSDGARSVCFHDANQPGVAAAHAELAGPPCVCGGACGAHESHANFDMSHFRVLQEEPAPCDLDDVQRGVCDTTRAEHDGVFVKYIEETGQFVTNEPTHEGPPDYELDNDNWWLLDNDCSRDRNFVLGPARVSDCFGPR